MVIGAALPTQLHEPDDGDWLAPATQPDVPTVGLDHEHEHLLRLAELKLEDEKTASRFKEPDYLDRLRLFVRAGHPQAHRLCACSYRGSWGGYPQVRRCNISNLCPFCSSVRHDKALLANLAAYHACGETAFVTLKYHGFTTPGHSAEPSSIKRLWQLATATIRLAIKHGLFTGALVSRELAVESLVPLRVMAHLHATVVGPRLNLDELGEALAAITQEVEGAVVTCKALNVTPKVHVGPHRDEGDMLRSIRYSMKTFGCSPGARKPSLPDLYRVAREGHSPYVVNDSVRELVHTFHQATYKRHRTSSLGVLSHMANTSLRVPKAKQLRPKNISLVNVARTKARHSTLLEGIKRVEEGLSDGWIG